jgi:hypothetical protein
MRKRLSPVDIEMMKNRILYVNKNGGNLVQVAEEFGISVRMVRKYASKLPGYVARNTGLRYQYDEETPISEAKGKALAKEAFEAYVKGYEYLTLTMDEGIVPPAAWGQPVWFYYQGFRFNQVKVAFLYDWCYDKGYLQHTRRAVSEASGRVNGIIGGLEKKAKRIEKLLKQRETDV